jgi:hypothetical protein
LYLLSRTLDFLGRCIRSYQDYWGQSPSTVASVIYFRFIDEGPSDSMPDHCSCRVDQDGNNHTVQTNSLGKNEDKDHTNENAVTLGESSNTGVTGNSDSES